jgi:hypothetical protein
VSEKTQDVLLKLLACALGLWGLVYLVEGLDASGVFAKLWALVAGIFVMATAVGFWKRRGWAFLMVSVGLLVGFLLSFVRLLLAFDTGEGLGGPFLRFLVILALIAYLGRWSIERRFRPHLDD